MISSNNCLHKNLAAVAKLVVVAAVALLSACSDNNNNNNDDNPYAELVDQGATRYLGMYTPMISEVNGDIVQHRFDNSEGPMCMRGTPYTMATRDKGSEDLVIFLQGGGGCWPAICQATEEASDGIPAEGILDPALPGNPIADWNVAFFPYCDGGVHASDADYVDYAGDPKGSRFHHGLHNLSAGLDATVNTFPSPRRILLAGVSGGGFGSIFAVTLVRTLYPGVPIEVLNDSGVAVGRPDDPIFFEELLGYWNILDSFLPQSCPDCIADNGHGTNIFNWQLQQDKNLRISLMSHKQDTTISSFFFGVGGPAWEPALISEMERLQTANPGRLQSLIADGSEHTFLGERTGLVVDGITVLDWVTAMLEDSPEWTSRLD